MKLNEPIQGVTFDEAQKWVERGMAVGVGFLLTKELNMFAIEIDIPKQPTATILALQSDTFELFKDKTYIERNPEKNGYLIWGYGVVSNYEIDGIRINSDNSWIALTFDPVCNVPITACQSLVDNLVTKMRKIRLST